MRKNTTSTKKTRNSTLNTLDTAAVATVLKVVIEALVLILGNRTSAKKLVAMILLAIDLPVAKVMLLSGMGKTSTYKLRRWVRAGLTAERIVSLLIVKGNRGRPQKLNNNQKEKLSKHIDEKNYFTLRHIADYISETFDTKLALSTVSTYLKELGIKKYKCGSLPAKADPELQRQFYDETLLPLFERNKNGEIKLFFMDAAHFVIGNDFIAAIYGHARRFCRTFSGRKRYNVLGAIEYFSKKILTVTNDEYITATEVEELLRKMRKAYESIPISVVLDNARYQKCELVRKTAEELNIDLVYLPSYSPNLNLIERLWKYVKTELRCHYYDDFESFWKQIDTIILEAQTVKKQKLDSLIGEKIQFFDDFVNVDKNTYEEKERKTA